MCARKGKAMVILSQYIFDYMLLTCFSPHVSICSIYKYIEKSKNINYFEKKIFFFFFLLIVLIFYISFQSEK